MHWLATHLLMSSPSCRIELFKRECGSYCAASAAQSCDPKRECGSYCAASAAQSCDPSPHFGPSEVWRSQLSFTHRCFSGSQALYIGLGPCNSHHSSPHCAQTTPQASRRMDRPHQSAVPPPVRWNCGICSAPVSASAAAGLVSAPVSGKLFDAACDAASAAAELVSAPVSGKLFDAACGRVVVVGGGADAGGDAGGGGGGGWWW